MVSERELIRSWEEEKEEKEEKEEGEEKEKEKEANHLQPTSISSA